VAGDRLITIDVGAREAPLPGATVTLALDPAALIVLPQR
jgi:hypothetical protein